MNTSKLLHFELNIDYELYIFCDIEKISGEVNPMYREKNFSKKNHELSYVGLIQDEKQIIVRNGIFTYVFRIIAGDTTELRGEYAVKYFNKKGRVIISECEDD